jgi:hypothetical protein
VSTPLSSVAVGPTGQLRASGRCVHPRSTNQNESARSGSASPRDGVPQRAADQPIALAIDRESRQRRSQLTRQGASSPTTMEPRLLTVRAGSVPQRVPVRRR